MRKIAMALALLLMAVFVRDAGSDGRKMVVQVKSATIRSAPRYLSKKLRVVSRHEPLTVLGSQKGFYKVSTGSGTVGWISKRDVGLPGEVSNLTLSSEGQSGRAASRRNLELAGRGFNEKVEEKYRRENPDLNDEYKLVDKIQATSPNLDAVADFARAGNVGGVK